MEYGGLMLDSIDLSIIFGSDFVGVLLLVIILFTRGWSLPARKKESKLLLFILIVSLINCTGDIIATLCDGRPGLICYWVAFFVNTYLYLYYLFIGISIIYLVVRHIEREAPRFQSLLFIVIIVIEASLLIINFFEPVVFYMDEDNVYHRAEFFGVFVLAGLLLIFYGFVFYFVSKVKNPALRYFPVWQFLVPILVGVFVQSFIYGATLLPSCFTIAFAALVICLQNECIYIDKLTGVYNRYELEKIMMVLNRRRSERIAALMLDLNDFKFINDNYSHTEGDNALIAFADIMVDVVKSDGIVIRFAGDEFLIIMRRFKDVDINDYKERILKAVDEYNNDSGKPYKLSVAVGGAIFEYNDESASEFMDKIDALMYKDKAIYYKENGHR